MLIIEDGTGLDLDANSYVDLVSIKAYAELHSVDISAYDDDNLTGFALNAMEYLESVGSIYKGLPTSATQPLEWPRDDVWGIKRPDHYTLPTEIPYQLKKAQLELTMSAREGDVMPNRSEAQILSRSITGGSQSYAQLAQTSLQRKTDAILLPLKRKYKLTTRV